MFIMFFHYFIFILHKHSNMIVSKLASDNNNDGIRIRNIILIKCILLQEQCNAFINDGKSFINRKHI